MQPKQAARHCANVVIQLDFNEEILLKEILKIQVFCFWKRCVPIFAFLSKNLRQ
jgi:hypothetical protein